jgi:SNF2 family DNA or RNA helicase
VTGTPIQNSLEDLASLIKFLSYPLLEDTRTFRRHMYIAKRTKMTGNDRKPDYGNLKLLLGQICLRRSTLTILTSLDCTFVEHRPRLSEKERKDYDMLFISYRHAIEICVASRLTRGGNRAVLTALLRLRIFCNTGMSDIGDNFMPDETISLLQEGGETICTECNSDALFSGAADSIKSQKRHQSRVKKCQRCAQWDSSSENSENISKEPQSLTGLDIDDLISHAQTEPGQQFMLNHNSLEPHLYPSKIINLLADIKKFYLTDKR